MVYLETLLFTILTNYGIEILVIVWFINEMFLGLGSGQVAITCVNMEDNVIHMMRIFLDHAAYIIMQDYSY